LTTREDENDVTLIEPQSVTGLVTKRRALSLQAAAAGLGASVPGGTGLMYNDIASHLSLMGAPLVGSYNGGPARHNAQYASDQLFLSDVEIDPSKQIVIDTPHVDSCDED
jgi:hypothetical protein